MGFKSIEEWAAENPQEWLKDWKTCFTVEKPSLISLKVMGDLIAFWENTCGEHKDHVKSARSQSSRQKRFQETSQSVLPPYCRAALSPSVSTLSPHAQPISSGTRSVQTQNIAGLGLWTSQGLRGKGDTFFIMKNVQKEMWSFSETDLPQESTPEALWPAPAELVGPSRLRNWWLCGLVLTYWGPAWMCLAVCLSFASVSK